MIKTLVLLVGLAFTGMAQAQIKCWVEASGKRACGDSPPAGAKVLTSRGAPMPAETATPAAPKDTQKSPAAQAAPAASAARLRPQRVVSSVDPQKCGQAQEALSAMKAGGRSQRTDAVKARAMAQENC